MPLTVGPLLWKMVFGRAADCFVRSTTTDRSDQRGQQWAFVPWWEQIQLLHVPLHLPPPGAEKTTTRGKGKRCLIVSLIAVQRPRDLCPRVCTWSRISRTVTSDAIHFAFWRLVAVKTEQDTDQSMCYFLFDICISDGQNVIFNWIWYRCPFPGPAK